MNSLNKWNLFAVAVCAVAGTCALAMTLSWDEWQEIKPLVAKMGQIRYYHMKRAPVGGFRDRRSPYGSMGSSYGSAYNQPQPIGKLPRYINRAFSYVVQDS